MSKQKTSFSLSEKAIEQLAFIAKKTGWSQASILEDVLKDRYERVKKAFEEKEQILAERQAHEMKVLSTIPFTYGDRFKTTHPHEGIVQFQEFKETSQGIIVRMEYEDSGRDWWHSIREIKEPVFIKLPPQ